MSQTYTWSGKVYFADTDAAGVVHHAKYVVWLEAARIDFLDSIGHPYHELHRQKIGLAPVTIAINYHSPLVFGDTFTINLELSSLKGVSITISHTILKHTQLMVSGSVKLACLNEAIWKPRRLPEALFNDLKRFYNKPND